MKIEEKLMKLRKENAWSQEDFANKLNVSRQTISKWELGQTVPDTNNLSKIATIFGISVNDLLDENIDPTEKKIKNDKNIEGKKQKNEIKIFILVIVLILAILGILIIMTNKIYNKIRNNEMLQSQSISEMFEKNSISDVFNTIFTQWKNLGSDSENDAKRQWEETSKNSENEAKRQWEDSSKKFEKDKFNNEFLTLYYGSTNGFFMNNFIDSVILSNEQNPEHIITVNYDGVETSNAEELRNMKNKFTKDKNYEIIYEYDENGLIKKAKVQ